MNCNGFEYPYKRKVNFEVVIFGDKGKAKLQIESHKDKAKNMVKIESIDLYSQENSFKVV